MNGWIDQLVVAPVLLPLLASALMLALNEKRRGLKRFLGLTTMAGLLLVSTLLLLAVAAPGDAGGPHVHLAGNWPAPFAIVLVADRLSALLLLLASILGTFAMLYAAARWDRAGPRFHALFLLLLTGVNGAFLTGDLFNLFVFFEVLLAASYGLLLHGAGAARTSAALHYVPLNIVASILFLLGVAMLYAVTGTLHMADMALSASLLPAENLPLLQAGAAILAIAFLTKAAIWPLCFWLPRTYGVATPPVAALFAILTKVGIYILLRLSSLLLDTETGAAGDTAHAFLVAGGFATMAFGTLGILASRKLTQVAGNYLLVSSGTLLAAIGIGGQMMLAALLFYFASSTLGAGALYLVIEPVERNAEEGGAEEGRAGAGGAGQDGEPAFRDEYSGRRDLYVGVPRDDDAEDEAGVVIPGTIAILGGCFIICALLLAGLPPFSGFIGKFAILDALFQKTAITPVRWTFVALLALSGLASMISMSRAGIDLLWTPARHNPPPLNVIEIVPIWLLLGACLALTVAAGPVMRYMEQTAENLVRPATYINAVLEATPMAAGA